MPAAIMPGQFEISGMTFLPSGEVACTDAYGRQVTFPQGVGFSHLYVHPFTWSRGREGILTGVSPSGETLRLRFAGGRWLLERLPPRRPRVEAPNPPTIRLRWRRVSLPLPEGDQSGERDGVRYYKCGYCEIDGIGVPLGADDVTTRSGIRIIDQEKNLWCFDRQGQVRPIPRRWRYDVFGSEYGWAVFVPEVDQDEPPPRGSFRWYAEKVLTFIGKALVCAFILYMFLAFWPVVFGAPGIVDEWTGPQMLDESDAPSLS